MSVNFLKPLQGDDVECSLKYDTLAVLPQSLSYKINQKINYSKFFLISPLNSIIKEQSTTLGSDAAVIDRIIKIWTINY